MEKRELNNKGFSLVELIIVIAIMAVLVGILAPQFLKYVENSRNSADEQTATEIATAIQTYAADPEADALPKDDYTIIIGDDSSTQVPASSATDAMEKWIYAAMENASIDISNTRCKSKSKWVKYSIKVDAKSGDLQLSYSAEDGSGTTVNDFAEDMQAAKATTGGGSGD